MELPLHVATDEWGDGWVVRIVDNKAVIQFEAIVGPNEDHAVIAARAEKITKSVNCHNDLLEACDGLIVALRAQAQLAVSVGGDIALHDGNAAAWDKAKTAIKKTKEQ